MKNTKFDQTEFYKQEIYDKINEIKLLCNREKIPMFFACAVKNDNKNTVYETEFIGTGSNEIGLKDDKITDFINVVNGFSTTPPKAKMEIEYKD
jgi:hypothetical protein